uniref:Uncharacterized protein n=1 Tax=Romanomermis culicivorax TaxID=13658 RepID=A0A915JNH7_ROMCU
MSDPQDRTTRTRKRRRFSNNSYEADCDLLFETLKDCQLFIRELTLVSWTKLLIIKFYKQLPLQDKGPFKLKKLLDKLYRQQQDH